MTAQLDLPFPLHPGFPTLLEKIARADTTDLAIWCANNHLSDWCWTVDTWHTVLSAVQDSTAPQSSENSALLGVLIFYAAPFWHRSLEYFQTASGVWPLTKVGELSSTDDAALWESCCVAALWWSKCRWSNGVRQLLFMSQDLSWVDALMFRWMIPRTYSNELAAYPSRVMALSLPLSLFPTYQECLSPQWTEQIYPLPPPVSSVVASEIREILEQASLARTGILDRLLKIPPFIAVCLDEPSFLLARSARLGLTRVLESIDRAGLSTAPSIAEVAVSALLHGHKDVWDWAISRPMNDVKFTAFLAYQFNWVIPSTDTTKESAHWLVDWVCSTSDLMSNDQWASWSNRLAQVLLFHSDTMPSSFNSTCATLLEPDHVDRKYIINTLLSPLSDRPEHADDLFRLNTLALNLVLDSWPVPINSLESMLSQRNWERLTFHYRIQRVLLARSAGLSGQEGDESCGHQGRRRM